MLVIPYGDPQAHGTIGKTITFVRRRGIIYGKPYKVPDNPNTSGQQAQRASFSDAVESWRLTTPETKYYYDERASGMPYTGYNLYISKYLLGELPSTTGLGPLDIHACNISITRSSFTNGWRYIIQAGIPWTQMGWIRDNENIWNDGATLLSSTRCRVKIQENDEPINILLRDTISIDYDAVTGFLIYLPEVTADVELSVADDGSTYFDHAMTKLACTSGF